MERPVFTIVVATYNRRDELLGLFGSLAALDYPAYQFEVILVDDGSSSPVEPLVAPFREKLNLHCMRQANAGVARARQRGVDAARGQFLAFTDDDCCPAPDWLRSLESALTSLPGCAVGGRIVNGLVHNPYSTATQVLENYLRDYWNRGPAAIGFFPTSNLAMPTDLFRAIGGFDVHNWPHGGEDRDLCARWKKHGHPLVYAPRAVVHHHHHLTLSTFLRQHSNYGRGAFRFRLASAQRERRTIALESLSFYFRLPLSGLGHTRGAQILTTPILLTGAQIANALGFMREWASQRTSLTTKTPCGSV